MAEQGEALSHARGHSGVAVFIHLAQPLPLPGAHKGFLQAHDVGVIAYDIVDDGVGRVVGQLVGTEMMHVVREHLDGSHGDIGADVERAVVACGEIAHRKGKHRHHHIAPLEDGEKQQETAVEHDEHGISQPHTGHHGMFSGVYPVRISHEQHHQCRNHIGSCHHLQCDGLQLSYHCAWS